MENEVQKLDMSKYLEEEKKLQEKDTEILNTVKSKVSEKAFEEIQEIMKESYNYLLSIHTEPLGEFQETGKYIKGYYADQTTDGGHSGDDFAGTVSIEFLNGQFLQFNYEM